MNETHKHIREDQFWFTAAVVGFNTLVINTLVIKKDVTALPPYFLLVASAVVSVFGLHLILSRWVRDAVELGHITAPQFDNKTATACQRAGYTLWEIRAYLKDFGYIITEFSGTLFYVLLIVLTFAGVVLRCRS